MWEKTQGGGWTRKVTDQINEHFVGVIKNISFWRPGGQNGQENAQ